MVNSQIERINRRAVRDERALYREQHWVIEEIGKQLESLNITQEKLADHIGVSRYSINQLMNGRRRITANMALRFQAAFGVDAKHWLQLQNEADLRIEAKKVRKRITKLRPHD